ncbi:MAG: hypothetical protein JWR85_3151 [Marmoricola sp.]|nr:hypothetical protein [Marmoricola sp.]
MSETGLGLSYWLAQTQFAVTLSKRKVIEAGNFGSYARPMVDVLIVPSAVADPSSRQDLTIDAALLDRLSLTINLDDRGLIESVTSEASRNVSPVINLLGDAASSEPSLAVTFRGPVDDKVRQRPLEEEWGQTNGQLAVHASEIEANIGRLLNDIGQASVTASSILQSGHALELLQSQLAAISQIKRTWLAGQAREFERREWRLTTADLLHIADTELPQRLADTSISGPLGQMVEGFGVLIAIADRDRSESDAPVSHDLRDTLVLRRGRPVTIGAYLPDKDGTWLLEPGSALAIEIVDEFSGTDHLSLDGSWLRGKSFNLAFHPDMSLKTLGLTSTVRGSGATTRGNGAERPATGNPVIRPRIATGPLVEPPRPPLELLGTTSGYEVLAATRAQAGEPTLFEQRRKVRGGSESN